MRCATQLCAENVKRSGSDWLDPEIGHHAWDHIHLGSELRHIEVVQDVNGAKQDLDRLSDGQMQVAIFDDDVVLPMRIVAVRPMGFSELMLRTSVVPSRPSLPGRRKLHYHCWPMTSISVASAGTVTNWCQTKRPGANMAATPTPVPTVSHHSSLLFSGL